MHGGQCKRSDNNTATAGWNCKKEGTLMYWLNIHHKKSAGEEVIREKGWKGVRKNPYRCLLCSSQRVCVYVRIHSALRKRVWTRDKVERDGLCDIEGVGLLTHGTVLITAPSVWPPTLRGGCDLPYHRHEWSHVNVLIPHSLNSFMYVLYYIHTYVQCIYCIHYGEALQWHVLLRIYTSIGWRHNFLRIGFVKFDWKLDVLTR